MVRLIDIHAHILPGIDDGPTNFDETLEMARAAADSGVEAIVATPHLRPDFPAVHIEEVAERCEAVAHALARERIPLRIVPGAEASLVWALEADDDQLVLASYDQRGTDLLIETPAASVAGLDRLLYELRLRGMRTTLAHPERSAEFQRDYQRLRNLVTQGVLLQLNADSLLEPRKSSRRQLAERLCQDGVAHAVASDGHRASSWRPVTRLAEAAGAIARLVGPSQAASMTSGSPAAIIEGGPLPSIPSARGATRRPRPFGRM